MIELSNSAAASYLEGSVYEITRLSAKTQESGTETLRKMLASESNPAFIFETQHLDEPEGSLVHYFVAPDGTRSVIAGVLGPDVVVVEEGAGVGKALKSYLNETNSKQAQSGIECVRLGSKASAMVSAAGGGVFMIELLVKSHHSIDQSQREALLQALPDK